MDSSGRGIVGYALNASLTAVTLSVAFITLSEIGTPETAFWFMVLVALMGLAFFVTVAVLNAVNRPVRAKPPAEPAVLDAQLVEQAAVGAEEAATRAAVAAEAALAWYQGQSRPVVSLEVAGLAVAVSRNGRSRN